MLQKTRAAPVESLLVFAQDNAGCTGRGHMRRHPLTLICLFSLLVSLVLVVPFTAWRPHASAHWSIYVVRMPLQPPVFSRRVSRQTFCLACRPLQIRLSSGQTTHEDTHNQRDVLTRAFTGREDDCCKHVHMLSMQMRICMHRTIDAYACDMHSHCTFILPPI